MKKPVHKIATKISKSHWYRIKKFLIANKWKLIEEYDQYDKSVDYDRYTFKKGSRVLHMAWSIHEKGELMTESKQFLKLSEKLGIPFSYGRAQLLRLGIVSQIKIYYKR